MLSGLLTLLSIIVSKSQEKLSHLFFSKSEHIGRCIKVEDLKLNMYDFFTQLLGFTSVHFGCGHRSKRSKNGFLETFCYRNIIFWHDFFYSNSNFHYPKEHLNIRK